MDEWTYNLIMRIEQRLTNIENILVNKFPDLKQQESNTIYKPEKRV